MSHIKASRVRIHLRRYCYWSFNIILSLVFTWLAKVYMCYRAESWLVSGVLMHRPYKLSLLFVQAKFQESRFIWPTCWELFGCLASCVQIGADFLFYLFTEIKCQRIRFQRCVVQIGDLKNSLSAGFLSLCVPLIHFHLSFRDRDRKRNVKFEILYVKMCSK